MRGEKVPIPFMGMNNQLLNDQSVDGLCDSIINLKPKGAIDKPYWTPFERIKILENTTGETFTYIHGNDSITDAFWQQRNFIGEFSLSENQSLKRLIVLCQKSGRKAIDIIDPVNWEIVKTQELPDSGAYAMVCTRVNEVTCINLTRNGFPYVLYYLVDDLFIKHGWPDMPVVSYTVTDNFYTEAQISSGATTGVQRKEDAPQYFMVTWAFRLFDGTYVKHNGFSLIEVPQGETERFTTVIFRHEGYTEELENKEFWEVLIQGVAVFCTLPRTDKQAALDDGAFFETGFFPWIDKLPESDWPTETDPNLLTVSSPKEKWPTFRTLGIDNFTHHSFSAYVIDSYSSRLLLGGSAVDFVKPNFIQSSVLSVQVPGGPYTDYMDFLSGSATLDEFFFDSSGFPSPPESSSYKVRDRQVTAFFTPKAGREFKSVGILSVNMPTPTYTAPHGEPFPTAQYNASIESGNIRLFHRLREVETLAEFPGTPTFVISAFVGNIGEEADQIFQFTVTMPIGLGAPYYSFTNSLVTNIGGDSYDVYQIITIRTDSGTYYRITQQPILTQVGQFGVPPVLIYPDRRAIRFQIVVKNGSIYEVAMDKKLTAHPESNYAYHIVSAAEQVYTIGTSVITTTEPNLALNDINQWVRNRIQASVTSNPYLFEIASTYRVGNRENDQIMGFGVNLDKTSEGQFGQYPLYVFSDKGCWVLEQISDPTVAFGKISPVTNFNGLNNHYAIANAGRVIIACDNKYIYSLAGYEAVRIDEAIANDPDYKEYLKQIRIGYHRATDYEEIIFSNPFFDYSLCYNLRYNVWYKATERYRFFFYSYPELMALTVDHAVKDFSNKDEISPVQWSLTSRVIQFQQPYVYKRLFPSMIRMGVKQPLLEDPQNYHPVRIRLKGYRDDQNIEYNLYDQSIKTNYLYDPRIYVQYGSMYAYRLILSGTNYHKDAQIQKIDSDVEYRYASTRRRFNCSAQYLYTLENSSISICKCAEGEANGDPYFVYTGEAESSRVITHNLGKIPSVFVTDLNGFMIECGVQLLFVDGQPDNNRIRLTFDDPVPYKAYFN